MRALLLSLLLIFGVATASLQPQRRDGFSCSPIPDEVFERMRGKSYPAGCPVAREDLRYLKVKHYDFEGKVRSGEIVCSRLVADDLLQIMRELFDEKYPIEQIRLIDDFGADDKASMKADNTSAFNYRRVAGSARISRHGYGLAIDINPLYNPCVKNGVVIPAEGKPYSDRSGNFAHKIDRGDAAYRIFTAHGWSWGGSWRSLKDYQHFEKKVE